MKLKKKKKANMERFRFIFFEIGVILALSILLFAFSWSSSPEEQQEEELFSTVLPDQYEMISTQQREETKPLEKLKIKTIINIVEDWNQEIEDFELYTTEIRGDEAFEILDFGEPENFDEEPVRFIDVKEKPLFNGGDPEIEFRKFIAKNVDYPDEAIENGVTGRVTLSFIIDKTGELIDVKLIGSAHPVLDKEALRVIKSSPKWTPGKQRTKPVKVLYQFPVVFILN